MRTHEDRLRFRLTVLGVVVLSLISVLTSRLWYLQVLAGERFAAASERNRVRIVSVEAPRGRILDRNGEVLVRNRPSLAVGIRRDDLPRDDAEELALKKRLAKLLGMKLADLEKRLRDQRVSPYTPVVIKEDVPPEVIFAIRERQEEFPSVETMTLPVRTYPKPTLAAHALGYVGEINDTELESRREKGYRLGDSIGKSGVERSYDAWLRGRAGVEKLEVDAAGRVLRSLGRVEPQPGADLTLTIDGEVQEVVEDALAQGIEKARTRVHAETRKRFRATGGGAVVLDAKTGEVVALASAPTFDLSRFVGGISPEHWAELNDPENHYPLLNRAVQAAYPPGSTVKPMVALAALHTGIAELDDTFPCLTAWDWGGTIFRNWQPRNANISVGQALVESCDTVFYEFGKRWWLKERAVERQGKDPVETMQQWILRFGLGREARIDLPEEADGRVPGRKARYEQWERNRADWCAAYRRSNALADEDRCRRGWLWRGGDAVNMSIGQGELLVSPLQLAVGYAAIANGGRLVQPHLAKTITPVKGKPKTVRGKTLGTVKLRSAELAYITRALARTSADGTARGAFAGWPHGSIPVAAKTGTADIQGKQPFSWFASFAPANDPKYVVVAVVEEAGAGSQIAGPIVRRVMDKLFGRNLTPVYYDPRRSD